jgi:hypothetical protein
MSSVTSTVESVSMHNSQLNLYLIAILENTDFCVIIQNIK